MWNIRFVHTSSEKLNKESKNCVVEKKKVNEKLMKNGIVALQDCPQFFQIDLVKWMSEIVWTSREQLTQYLWLVPTEQNLKEWEEVFRDDTEKNNIRMNEKYDTDIDHVVDFLKKVEQDLEKFYDTYEEIVIDLEKFSLKDIPVSFLNQESFRKLPYDKKYLTVFLYKKFGKDEILKKMLEADVSLTLDGIFSAYTDMTKLTWQTDKIIEEVYNYDINTQQYKKLIDWIRKYVSQKKMELDDEILEKQKELDQLRKEQELVQDFIQDLDFN